jgi:diguanylate cyclase (GGDEF)-like protein
MIADKQNHWNNQTTQKLVRYEALFKLLDEIRLLDDINKIAKQTSRQWKYFSNVTCWHAVLFFNDFNTIIDSSHGEVSLIDSIALSDWDEHFRTKNLPYLIKRDDDTNPLEPPKSLQHPMVVEIQVLPIMRQDRCIGILSAGANKVPFTELDLRFLVIFGNHLIDRLYDSIIQKNYQDLLLVRASFDVLTGLLNRATILDKLDSVIELSKRTGSLVSIILLDIDYFKHVNDTYGHAGGDMVLREFARRLKKFGRMIDDVGRYGGEEFLYLIYPSNEEQAFAAAERLRKTIVSQPFPVGNASGDEIMLTISLGTATFRGEKSNTELIQDADMALYRSKKNGRNQTTQFCPE